MEAEIIKLEDKIEPITATANHYQLMIDFVKQSMRLGQDYGIIPGTNNKPTLLKPGAENGIVLDLLKSDWEKVDKG